METSLLSKLLLATGLLLLTALIVVRSLHYRGRLPREFKTALREYGSDKQFATYTLSLISIVAFMLLITLIREYLSWQINLSEIISVRALLLCLPAALLILSFSSSAMRGKRVNLCMPVAAIIIMLFCNFLEYKGFNTGSLVLTHLLYLLILILFTINIFSEADEVRMPSISGAESVRMIIYIISFIYILTVIRYLNITAVKVFLSSTFVILFNIMALKRCVKGTFMLFTLGKEERIEILKPLYLFDGECQDSDKSDPLNDVKERLLIYFKEKKPYLSHNLKIEDVALAIITNKTYLSRTLNTKMNVNFNQFVNYHRVKEGMSIFIQEQDISINELCARSGFKNMASFIHSFRLYTGYTPSDWCKEIKFQTVRSGNEETKFNIAR